MRTVALQQVTSGFARNNAGKTLEKPIALKYAKKYLAPELFAKLEAQCPEGRVFVWGAKLERSHQFQKMLPRRCLVLFRRGEKIYKTGVILEWTVSLELAEFLWGLDTDAETWGLVYFLKTVKDVSIPASEINRLVGRTAKDHWQGLVAVSAPESDTVISLVKSRLEARPAGSGAQPAP